jgi:hypothetical protein
MTILARGMGKCHSYEDGECFWRYCPQKKDKEPETSGRHCPYDIEAKKDGEYEQ